MNGIAVPANFGASFASNESDGGGGGGGGADDGGGGNVDTARAPPCTSRNEGGIFTLSMPEKSIINEMGLNFFIAAFWRHIEKW